MSKHKPLALCISGSAARHKQEILKLSDIVSSTCESVETLIHPSANTISRSVEKVLKRARPKQIVLITFCGHGSQLGWETSFGIFLYWSLVRLLQKYPDVFVTVVNGTCYSHYLIKHLIGSNRPGTHTGVLTFWEGYTESYDETLDIVTTAWQERRTPEDLYRPHVFSSLDGYDVEFTPIHRWGAIFDAHFFAEA